MGQALDTPFEGPRTYKDNEWRCAPKLYKYPALELVCKTFGMSIGFRMLMDFIQRTELVPSALPEEVPITLMALLMIMLGVATIVGLGDRILSKELFSVFFVVFNAIAHWAMAMGALTEPPATQDRMIGSVTVAGAFAFFNIVGEVFNFYFIRKNTDLYSPGVLKYRYAGNALFAGSYFLIMLLDTIAGANR